MSTSAEAGRGEAQRRRVPLTGRGRGTARPGPGGGPGKKGGCVCEGGARGRPCSVPCIPGPQRCVTRRRRYAMPHYLSDEELKRTAPAETASFRSPVPTQIVSNGEYNPPPQTREQQQVEARIRGLAEDLAPRHGMSRRRFLASSAGMAAAFLAMNEVFGSVFDVQPGRGPDARGGRRARRRAGRAVHPRRPDPLRARRLQRRRDCWAWPSTPSSTGTRRWSARTTSRDSSSRTTSRRSTSTATPRSRCSPARPSTIPTGTS